MKTLPQFFATTAAIALLAGCGGPQSGVNGAAPHDLVTQQDGSDHAGSRATILYATQETGVAMFSFPEGKPLGMISVAGPWSLCTDYSGNVWAGIYDRYAYEYTHDGYGPIATIDTGGTSPITGCAVDPTTGNVAVVASNLGVGIYQAGTWKGTSYPTPFDAYRCAYDANGAFAKPSICRRWWPFASIQRSGFSASGYRRPESTSNSSTALPCESCSSWPTVSFAPAFHLTPITLDAEYGIYPGRCRSCGGVRYVRRHALRRIPDAIFRDWL